MWTKLRPSGSVNSISGSTKVAETAVEKIGFAALGVADRGGELEDLVDVARRRAHPADDEDARLPRLERDHVGRHGEDRAVRHADGRPPRRRVAVGGRGRRHPLLRLLLILLLLLRRVERRVAPDELLRLAPLVLEDDLARAQPVRAGAHRRLPTRSSSSSQQIDDPTPVATPRDDRLLGRVLHRDRGAPRRRGRRHPSRARSIERLARREREALGALRALLVGWAARTGW